MAQVGITATDSTGQLRPIVEVMDELGKKFNTLNKNEQAYVTTALFGTYQRNRGITLLQNYNTSLENYEKALNSAGSTQEKFNIYLESPASSLDRLKASWEGMWQATMNSEALMWVVDGLTSMLNFLQQFGGVLPIIIGLLAGGLTAALITVKAGVDGLIVSFNVANLVTGGWITLIGIAASVLSGFIISQVNAKKEIDNANKALEIQTKSYQELQRSAEQSKRSIDEKTNSQMGEVVLAEQLANRIEVLSQKENKSNLEKEEMKRYVSQLNELIPDLNLSINSTTGQLEKQGVEFVNLQGAIDTTIGKYKALILVQGAQASAKAAGQRLFEAQLAMDKEKSKVPNFDDVTLGDKTKMLFTGKTWDVILKEKQDKSVSEYQKVIDSANATIKSSFDEAQKYEEKYGSKTKTKPPKSGAGSGVPTLGGSGSGSKDSSTSRSEIKDPEKLIELDRYRKLTEEIDGYRIALERAKAEEENATDISTKNQKLQEQIDLIKGQQQAVHNLAEAKREELAEIEKQINPATMNETLLAKKDLADAHRNDKDRTGYNALKQDYEDFKSLMDRYYALKKEVPNLSIDYLKMDKEIGSLNEKIANSIKEITEESSKLNDEIENINDNIKKLNKEQELENFKRKIEDSSNSIKILSNNIDLLKMESDLYGKNDFTNQLESQEAIITAVTEKGTYLREEFERLSKQIPENGESAKQLADYLSELGSNIRDNIRDLIEYNKNLDNIKLDSITSKFQNGNKVLSNELEILKNNVNMLYNSKDMTSAFDMFLPQIPTDYISSETEKNKKLIKEVEKREETIQRIMKTALQRQREDNDKFRAEEIAKLEADRAEKIKKLQELQEKMKKLEEEYLKKLDEINKKYNKDSKEQLSISLEEKRIIYETYKNNIIGYLAEIRKAQEEIEQSKVESENNEGQNVEKHAKGGTVKNGVSLVGEEGFELGILPNGETIILGKNGAELTDLPKGTQVIPHEESKDILSYTGNIDGEVIPKYKKGTVRSPVEIEYNKQGEEIGRTTKNPIIPSVDDEGSPVVSYKTYDEKDENGKTVAIITEWESKDFTQPAYKPKSDTPRQSTQSTQVNGTNSNSGSYSNNTNNTSSSQSLNGIKQFSDEVTKIERDTQINFRKTYLEYIENFRKSKDSLPKEMDTDTRYRFVEDNVHKQESMQVDLIDARIKLTEKVISQYGILYETSVKQGKSEEYLNSVLEQQQEAQFYGIELEKQKLELTSNSIDRHLNYIQKAFDNPKEGVDKYKKAINDYTWATKNLNLTLAQQEDIEKRIKELNINRAEDYLEYAKSLFDSSEGIKRYNKYINDLNWATKNLNLTEEQRNNILKEKKAIETEALKVVKEAYINYLTEALDEETKKLEENRDKAKESSEDKVRGLEEQKTALEETNKSLEEQEQRLEKINDIVKQRQLIANIEAERNVKIFKDGKWEDIADPRKLREENEKLQEMQKEFADWETGNARNAKVKAIQDEIDKENEKQRIKDEGYDNELKALQVRKDALSKAISDLDTQKIKIKSIDEAMQALVKVDATRTAELKTQLDTLTKMSGITVTTPTTTTTKSSSSSSSSSSSYNSSNKGSASNVVALANNSNNTSLGTMAANPTAPSNPLMFTPYDTGGYTGDWGSNEGKLAVLHEKELVLNQQDTPNLLSALNMSNKLINLVSSITPKMNMSVSTPSGDTFYLSDFTVETNDATNFITQLKRMVRS